MKIQNDSSYTYVFRVRDLFYSFYAKYFKICFFNFIEFSTHDVATGVAKFHKFNFIHFKIYSSFYVIGIDYSLIFSVEVKFQFSFSQDAVGFFYHGFLVSHRGFGFHGHSDTFYRLTKTIQIWKLKKLNHFFPKFSSPKF